MSDTEIDVTDEQVEAIYAGLEAVMCMEASTPRHQRTIVEEFMRPVQERGFRLAVAPRQAEGSAPDGG